MKRFYTDVTVVPADADSGDRGWRVLLDGRAIKTAAGAPQVVPARALAEALALEWEGQGETLDASRFVLRDLVDYAIDAIGTGREDAVTGLLPYAETDTLCYRADPDEPLHRRQLEVWEPVLQNAETRFGVRFVRVSGIVHKAQPPETIGTLHGQVAKLNPFALASMRMLTSLSASLVIALLAIEPDADIAALWNAANLEEDWQADLWGRDAEAEERREQRFAAFTLATRLAALARAQ